MKQLISLLLVWFLLLWGYYSWSIYFQKDYSSKYLQVKKSSNVNIQEIVLDEEKIDRLSKTIKDLKQDPVFKLELNEFTTRQGQPLFKEKYSSVYDKIVEQNQAKNKSY